MSTTSKPSLRRQFALIVCSASLAVINTALPAVAQRRYTRWNCWLTHQERVFAGSVTIWWGHTAGDAGWACDRWISKCGNNGGCYARYRGEG